MSITQNSTKYLNSSKNRISDSQLIFNYTIPINTELDEINITKENLQIQILKYYEGTISKAEHYEHKNNLTDSIPVPVKIYSYLFDYLYESNNFDDLFDVLISISNKSNIDDIINETMDLWFLTKESKAHHLFEKFIFLLYCVSYRNNIEKIALDYYKKVDPNNAEEKIAINDFLNKHNLQSHFDDLRNNFVTKIPDTTTSNTNVSLDSKKSSTTEDWIKNFIDFNCSSVN